MRGYPTRTAEPETARGGLRIQFRSDSVRSTPGKPARIGGVRALLALTLSALLSGCAVGDRGDGEPGPPAAEGGQATTAAEGLESQEEGAPRLRRSRGAPRIEIVATGLEVPWDVAFLPDGRALITERPGRIRLASRDGRVVRRPLARLPVAARGEGGLLGIAVDPAFGQGRDFVYVYLTRSDGMQVRRMRFRGGRLADDGLVLGGIAAGPIHDSGRLRFGPDRRLYIATGDAGRRQLAQDRRSRNGKILRLEPGQYRGRARRPEVFALGMRNPQGLAWRPRSRDLFATDHGPSGFDGPSGDDEVNLVRRGRNYGWPRVRGRRHAGFAAPVRVYRDTIAPSGAAFVSLPGSAWTGSLLVAALKGQELRQLRVAGGRLRSDRALLRGRFGRLRAVVEAPDGTIWVTTSNRDTYGTPRDDRDDRILRIVPPRG